MQPCQRAIMRVGMLLLIAACLSGCVRSESSRYQRTISGSVAPERRASADVAREFGLPADEGSALSLGATDR